MKLRVLVFLYVTKVTGKRRDLNELCKKKK